MRLRDSRRLLTALCGIRTKWPLEKRTPLYITHASKQENNIRRPKNTCSQVKGEMITDGRFIFSSVLLVFVRFFRFRIKFSLIPALKHAVNRHFWHRCRSVPDVKSHEFWPNRQMYSTLFSTDLLKKPFILFNELLRDGNNDFLI